MDNTVPINVDETKSSFNQNICELIYHVLRVLLLHGHNRANTESRGTPSKAAEFQISILQPVIDILQYRVFCERVEIELNKTVNALNSAGVQSTLSFASVGEAGQRVVSLLSGTGNKVVGGEAIIRMDNWCVYQTPFRTTVLRKGLQAYFVVYLCFALDFDGSPISSHSNNLFLTPIIAALKG